MGRVPPASSDATSVGSNNGEAMNVDVGGPSHWQEWLAPRDPVTVAHIVVDTQNVADEVMEHVEDVIE